MELRLPSLQVNIQNVSNEEIVILLLDRCQRTLFKTPSVLLGDVPTLPGVDEAYVQVGTGRGAPR